MSHCSTATERTKPSRAVRRGLRLMHPGKIAPRGYRSWPMSSSPSARIRLLRAVPQHDSPMPHPDPPARLLRGDGFNNGSYTDSAKIRGCDRDHPYAPRLGAPSHGGYAFYKAAKYPNVAAGAQRYTTLHPARITHRSPTTTSPSANFDEIREPGAIRRYPQGAGRLRSFPSLSPQPLYQSSDNRTPRLRICCASATTPALL